MPAVGNQCISGSDVVLPKNVWSWLPSASCMAWCIAELEPENLGGLAVKQPMQTIERDRRP